MFKKIKSKNITAWKVSKYVVFSGPYFPAFGLNTLFIQCIFRKLNSHDKMLSSLIKNRHRSKQAIIMRPVSIESTLLLFFLI